MGGEFSLGRYIYCIFSTLDTVFAPASQLIIQRDAATNGVSDGYFPKEFIRGGQFTIIS